MKKILFIGIAAGLMASCSESILDLKPYGAPGEGTFLQTESDVELAVNGLYYGLWDDAAYTRGPMYWINASDDMITGRINAEVDTYRNFAITASGSAGIAGRLWNALTPIMGRSNAVIKVENQIQMADQKKKNFLFGQAYFLNALVHFDLAKRFGNMVEGKGFPIPNRQDQLDMEYDRPANVNVNMDYIIADCIAAAERLPYQAELDPKDYGRPTKTAAWAWASKVALQKAWNCLKVQDDVGAQAAFQQAESFATQVIEATYNGVKCHELLPTYKEVFLIENNFSKEYIFSSQGGTFYAGSRPNMLPGMMLENKGWGKYNGFGYFVPTKSLYDEFEAGDQRRAVTILAPGDKFTYFGEECIYGEGDYATSSPTQMQFNKYMHPFSIGSSEANPNGDSPSTNLNVPIIRYAEVLLIRAEARIMQGKSGKEDLDKIRRRAGLPVKGSYTLEDLKHERRCELAGEYADRHSDLIRWGDAKATYAQPAYGFDGNQVWAGRNFREDRDDVYPIPENILLLMDNRWENNPNY